MSDFVNFKLAHKLKEKGFKEKVIKYYGKHENIFDCHPPLDMNDAYYRCSAPSISQVLKWLREEFSLHISQKPYSCEDGLMWMYEIRKFNKHIVFVIASKTGFVKEEEALLAGIEYVLDNLI